MVNEVQCIKVTSKIDKNADHGLFGMESVKGHVFLFCFHFPCRKVINVKKIKSIVALSLLSFHNIHGTMKGLVHLE